MLALIAKSTAVPVTLAFVSANVCDIHSSLVRACAGFLANDVFPPTTRVHATRYPDPALSWPNPQTHTSSVNTINARFPQLVSSGSTTLSSSPPPLPPFCCCFARSTTDPAVPPHQVQHGFRALPGSHLPALLQVLLPRAGTNVCGLCKQVQFVTAHMESCSELLFRAFRSPERTHRIVVIGVRWWRACAMPAASPPVPPPPPSRPLHITSVLPSRRHLSLIRKKCVPSPSP